MVFKEGGPADKMYAVISGEVEIIARGKVIDTEGESSIFGQMAWAEDLPRTASAIVKSEAKLIAIDRNRFSS